MVRFFLLNNVGSVFVQKNDESGSTEAGRRRVHCGGERDQFDHSDAAHEQVFVLFFIS